MEKLIFLEGPAERWLQFSNDDDIPVAVRGKRIAMSPADGESVYRFDDKVNMETGEVFRNDYTIEYKECELPKISEVMMEGNATDHTAYRQMVLLDVLHMYPQLLNEKRKTPVPDFDKIVEFVKMRGFNVSKKAIKYSYKMWRNGWKAGYRDEDNGVHVFNPCGGNPWNVHITELCPLCDWQKTYWC